MGNFFRGGARSKAGLRLRRGGPDLAFPRRGSTLLEIAIALAVVALLASIGYASARGQISQFRLMQTARLLHSDLVHLRAVAIAANRQTRLVLVDADRELDPGAAQAGSWLCQLGDRSAGSTHWDTLPADEGGVVDDHAGTRSLAPDGPTETPGISLASWARLAGPGTTNPDSIVFTPRGWVENPAGDFPDGNFRLRLVNKRAMGADGVAQEVLVRVTMGGLVRIETEVP